MAGVLYSPGPHTPLRPDDQITVQHLLQALARQPESAELAARIVEQAQCLDDFGALLARYPSPLSEQTLGGRRRDVDTLVAALCHSNRGTFTLRAPTQAIVGRALGMAQINFFRLLWHVGNEIGEPAAAAALREETARRLRDAVYTQLVEEVLSDLSADDVLTHELRVRAVRQLVQLWGHRLTWRVHEFFPLLEATWEARARVQVVGGTMLGSSEMFQLLAHGCDASFLELLLERRHGEDETQAFREFLFGRSSEDLDRLTERMVREGLSSIELDSQPDAQAARDAGSIFYEFFQVRFLQSNARRLAGQPGPQRTAEGYVVLAWLEREDGTGD